MTVPRQIERIAVVGAGTMGQGIAYVCSVAGFETRLYDVSETMLSKAQGCFERTLQKGVDRGKVDEPIAAKARNLFRITHTLEETTLDCDFVVEAVPEDLDLKVETFSKLDRILPSAALLASNTSSLSITELAAVTSRPGCVLGMHFFNPVPAMRLIELVRGVETEEETIATAREVAHKLGKDTVVVRDSPGFVTSRINALIGNEAFYLLQEGIASAEDIDKALKLGLNHPMGPFEMVDLVGLDVRLSILRFLHRTLGEKYRPAPLLEQYVKAGRLGRKVGKGVYDYGTGNQG